MRVKCRPIGLVLVLMICFVSIFPASVNAVHVNSTNSKILFIVDDISEFNDLLVSGYEGLYDVIDSNDISYSEICGYSAYAVQQDIVEVDKKLCASLQKEYYNHDPVMYLYGELTINDYKQALGIEEFGVYTSIFDQKGILDDKAFLSFSQEQEVEFVENIISSSASQEGNFILASVASEANSSSSQNQIKIILEDYSSSLLTPMSIIVKSGFNFRTYYGEDYINMDYRLYKDNDEIDPTYDYFALVTNLSANNYVYNTYSISARHTLPYSADEMIDYDPGDITRAYSVNGSLNMGSPGGSVGFSFEAGGGPTINATYSSGDDYCNWDITQYWLFGEPLDGTLFKLGSSWASTGTYAATDVKFRGCFSSPMGYVYTPWKYVSIRYEY